MEELSRNIRRAVTRAQSPGRAYGEIGSGGGAGAGGSTGTLNTGGAGGGLVGADGATHAGAYDIAYIRFASEHEDFRTIEDIAAEVKAVQESPKDVKDQRQLFE